MKAMAKDQIKCKRALFACQPKDRKLWLKTHSSVSGHHLLVKLKIEQKPTPLSHFACAWVV